MFFEETIGSLEEEFENDGAGRTAQRHTPAEMRPASYERDHDIIDLVHVTPEDKHTNVMPGTTQKHQNRQNSTQTTGHIQNQL